MKYRDLSKKISIYDKHRLEVGEPRHSFAAVERGRQFIVSQTEMFAVGDHYFTRFSIIPSVVLQVYIPETFEGSWYQGKVLVGIKDAILFSTASCNRIM